MRSYDVEVRFNPHSLDMPARSALRGRVGRLETAVRDHLHHVLGTDDVQLMVRERDTGATATAVIGARSGRCGAALELILTPSPPADTSAVSDGPSVVSRCLELLRASAHAHQCGDRVRSRELLAQARALAPELVLEVGRGIATGEVPRPTDSAWTDYATTRAT